MVGNRAISSLYFHSDSAKSRMDVLFIALLVAPLILGKSPSDPGLLYQVFCYKWDERKDTKRGTFAAFQQGAVLLFSTVGVQGRGQNRDLEGGARKPKAKQSEVLSKKRQADGGWSPKRVSSARLNSDFCSCHYKTKHKSEEQ